MPASNCFMSLFSPACDEVIKRTALGHFHISVAVSFGFVGHVFYEKERENVVLVLAGVHATPKFVGSRP